MMMYRMLWFSFGIS